MFSFTEFVRQGIIIPDREALLRELLAYDVQCPVSFQFKQENGTLFPIYNASSLHWSRQFEWPWAIYHGDLEYYHRCLDVGGSWSIFKNAIAKRAKSVTVIDNDPEAVRKGDYAWRTAFNFATSRVDFVIGDVRQLPWPDGWFDRVFCVSVLEHLPSGWDIAFNEMMRVLKPRGYLILTMDLALVKGTGNEQNVSLEEAGRLFHDLHIPNATHGADIMSEMEDGSKIVVSMTRMIKE